MGLAYGYSPKELGMDKLIVSADPLIRRITKAEAAKIKEGRSGSKESAESESKGSNRSSRRNDNVRRPDKCGLVYLFAIVEAT